MKTKSKSKKSIKYIFGLVVVFLFFAGLTVFILEKTKLTNFITLQKTNNNTTQTESTIDNNPPTPEQKAAGDLQKETASTPTNNDLGISITSKQTSASLITIKSIIDGAVTNSGLCTLTLTKGSVVITKTAETYAMTNYSTCKGFNIDRTELSNGEWKINLSVLINEKESSISDKLILE